MEMRNVVEEQTQTNKGARVQMLIAVVLVLGTLFVVATQANAQQKSPATPTTITPPAGNTAFLLGQAKVGTQGYVCLPTATGASWTVNNSRPEATLFTTLFGRDYQIITHFLSPNTNPNGPDPVPFGNATWQSSFDSSVVWAKALSPNVTAGTDASCPNAGSIPCLLLQSVGSKVGPTGGKLLANVTYIQRLNTKGGAAPTTGCSAATDVGKQVLVPYTADYYFFSAN
jgi:Protein of unknown function (DUF3455)